MALDFTVKDVSHKVKAKFVHTFLPDTARPFGTRKPYNLRAVFYPEVRMQSAVPFRQYIRNRVEVKFGGVDQLGEDAPQA
jgi:hypothetical protein